MPFHIEWLLEGSNHYGNENHCSLGGLLTVRDADTLEVLAQVDSVKYLLKLSDTASTKLRVEFMTDAVIGFKGFRVKAKAVPMLMTGDLGEEIVDQDRIDFDSLISSCYYLFHCFRIKLSNGLLFTEFGLDLASTKWNTQSMSVYVLMGKLQLKIVKPFRKLHEHQQISRDCKNIIQAWNISYFVYEFSLCFL